MAHETGRGAGGPSGDICRLIGKKIKKNERLNYQGRKEQSFERRWTATHPTSA